MNVALFAWSDLHTFQNQRNYSIWSPDLCLFLILKNFWRIQVAQQIWNRWKCSQATQQNWNTGSYEACFLSLRQTCTYHPFWYSVSLLIWEYVCETYSPNNIPSMGFLLDFCWSWRIPLQIRQIPVRLVLWKEHHIRTQILEGSYDC